MNLIITEGDVPYYRILHCACTVLRFLVKSVHAQVAVGHCVQKRLVLPEGNDRTSWKSVQRYPKYLYSVCMTSSHI